MRTWPLILVGLLGPTLACAPDFDEPASGVGPTTAPGGLTTTVAGGTTGATVAPNPPRAVPRFVDDNGFDDHSVPRLESVDDLLALSRPGVGGQSSMKFTITEFDQGPANPVEQFGRVHLMDSNFYSLHDEWYWFRLLNGQPVAGVAVAPVEGLRFATVAEIYRWANGLPPDRLPLDLQFSTGPGTRRLYSDEFYDIALSDPPRQLGAGAIVRLPNTDPAGSPHWLIELEFSDQVSPALIEQFFERLIPVLPEEVSRDLQWVVRSAQQADIAKQMIDQRLPYFDRVVYFSELVPAGTVGVYSEGITAGRLLYVDSSGEAGGPAATIGQPTFGDAREGDIIVTERAPDWLPPANALITSDPQTPLAHVNLLARNRGIPNASQVGIHDDPGLRQAARVRAYALVIAQGTSLRIALISRQQYEEWTARLQRTPATVPPVTNGDLDVILNLNDLVTELTVGGPEPGGMTAGEIDALRPVIGGKSAGFLTLLATPGLDPPPDPLAITVRPYNEHIASLRSTIVAVLAHPTFVESPRARWLALEGSEEYATIFASPNDEQFARSLLAAHPPGTAFGDVLAAGGIRALIEAKPIAANTLDAIVDELSFTYRDYDIEAGLRFRSSSSVEDIEGFNGAGLYTSYTGYLRPELLSDPDDRDNTIERALQRAWGSYWSYEAFEERRLERIDHLSGAMGLTVHARFDDDLERNNGVATLTYLPRTNAIGRPSPVDLPDAVVEVNVQVGSTAVTNPEPRSSDLPEVLRVSRLGGELVVERLGTSSLAEPNQPVMTDAAVFELFAQVDAVGHLWLERSNRGVPSAVQIDTIVLDFEFKTVDEGWPRLASDADPYPARLVIRQVRSLDPGLRDIPLAVAAMPIPLDVLRRARRIEQVECPAAGGQSTRQALVFTDPLQQPDVGFASEPLAIALDNRTPVSGASCTTTTLFATANEYLVGLIDAAIAGVNNGVFIITGG